MLLVENVFHSGILWNNNDHYPLELVRFFYDKDTKKASGVDFRYFLSENEYIRFYKIFVMYAEDPSNSSESPHILLTHNGKVLVYDFILWKSHFCNRPKPEGIDFPTKEKPHLLEYDWIIKDYDKDKEIIQAVHEQVMPVAEKKKLWYMNCLETHTCYDYKMIYLFERKLHPNLVIPMDSFQSENKEFLFDLHDTINSNDPPFIRNVDGVMVKIHPSRADL